MDISEKLSKYFEETGVQKKFFAQKVGMDFQFLYHVTAGRRIIPPKYWRNIIKMTRGYITMTDLLQPFASEIEGALVEQPGKNPAKAIIEISDLFIEP